MSHYWNDQNHEMPRRTRNRRPRQPALDAAIISGVAAVIAALSRALRDDNGWGPAAFPLAGLSVVLSVVAGGWWLADRHKKNDAGPGWIVTAIATLVLTPLLVLFLMTPKGTQSTLVALDAKTGRQLWLVHPQAFWLAIPTVSADAVSVIGFTFKTSCQAEQFRYTFSRQTGQQQSRRSTGSAPYPPQRVTVRESLMMNNPPGITGNPATPSPDLLGPAAAGFRLDRPGEALTRLDPQGRKLWSAPIPVVSQRSIVTTMIADGVVYVAADGERHHHCPSD